MLFEAFLCTKSKIWNSSPLWTLMQRIFKSRNVSLKNGKKASRSSYDDLEDFNWTSRSSQRRCSVGKGVLRKFVKFTVNHLCYSLHSTSVRPATLLKERIWHNWFPVNFANISKNNFFTKHLCTTASEFLCVITKNEKNILHQFSWQQNTFKWN